MDEETKDKITAAVVAAIEAIGEKAAESVASPPIERHRFGQFRVPDGAHIKGFAEAFGVK